MTQCVIHEMKNDVDLPQDKALGYYIPRETESGQHKISSCYLEQYAASTLGTSYRVFYLVFFRPQI